VRDVVFLYQFRGGNELSFSQLENLVGYSGVRVRVDRLALCTSSAGIGHGVRHN